MKYLPVILTLALCACGSNGGDPSVSAQRLYESDDANCGALGYECVDGRTCSDSRCSPAWIEIASDGAPTLRGKAAAAFMDGKYVVFGGCTSTMSATSASSDGGSYDPDMDSWGSFPSLSVPRAQHSAVTTDSGIYSIGGISTCWNGSAVGPILDVLYSMDGGWSRVDATGLDYRFNAVSSWTGDRLFTYGGSNSVDPTLATGGILSLGGQWKNTSCGLLGCERYGQYSLFHDKGVIHVWGGYAVASTDGLLYDLKNETWYDWIVPAGTPDFSSVSPDGEPPRFADDGRRLYYLSANGHVLIFDRQTQEWVDDSSAPPTGFCAEAPAAWSGSEVIAWSGLCDNSFSSVGARYQPPAP